GGGASGRIALAGGHETAGGMMSARLLDVRQLPVGWAGWGGDVFGGLAALTDKRGQRDGSGDAVADVLDPQLRTMIDALLKGGDGDLVVLRQGDGRFHFYLPEALGGGELKGLGDSFADFSSLELRRSLGYQDYRRLAHLADKPGLQLSYNRAVPEPGALMMLGVAGMLMVRRRKSGTPGPTRR
ncbi:MAG TPA: PEP-CTERM sorting domain-containing protein, partial [Tepidisphaeraceae bacterium]|nr:PEP-CTERM sorting domain-containing protein [Tepidisphaeraceae bacterium]